ncbi:MAG: DUF4383 domain-containing protein [Candidatus Dormibacteria bacterium]
MPLSKLAAGVFGAVYLLVGIVGFFVTGLSGQGTLIIFPLSPLHNVVHLAIGAAGLAAYFGGPALSRRFCQVVGAVLALVAVLGIIVSNPLGILPIGGFDIVLHIASALVLMYIGFAGDKEYATA